jgi:hypothetical protein
MGVRFRVVDGDDVQHVLGALVGVATVPTRWLRPAPGESGGRHGADAQPHHGLHSGRIWLLGRPNTSWPLPGRPVIDHARALYRNNIAMIGIVDLERAEADLVAGELTCRDAVARCAGGDTRGPARSVTRGPRH